MCASPPGLVAYIILDQFMGMLEDSKFFKYLNQEYLLNEYKAPMMNILKD